MQTRRKTLAALATLTSLPALFAVPFLLSSQPVQAQPQAWPSRPLRIVVGFTAGGPVDLVARIVAPRLSVPLGQPVIVENRPGADANIAMEVVARASPDGYTLLLIQPGVAINPPLYGKVPFDPIKDFAPISLIGESPNIVAVHNGLPANTMQELLALARALQGGRYSRDHGDGRPSGDGRCGCARHRLGHRCAGGDPGRGA